MHGAIHREGIFIRQRIWNIGLALAVLAGDLLYLNLGGLWLKSLTSMGFLVQGGGNHLFCRGRLTGNRKKFSVLMVWGLFFSMLGDVVINLQFMSGAVIFAVGHVCYLLAYCRLAPMEQRDLKIGAAIFAVSALTLLGLPVLDFGGGLMKLVCLLYALVISLMVGKAVGNHVHLREQMTCLLAIGSVLFFLSDLMLLFDVFADAPRVTTWLCLLFYYPAQCLLAGALSKT